MSDMLVLCYHAVSDAWSSPLAVPSEQLDRQIRALLGRGYVATTFERAVTSPPAARTLAVTFDDGYRSVLTHGLPVLDALNVPATVFVPTDFVGTDGPMSWPGIEHWTGTPYEDELICLSWDELRTLRERGWEIGSHTCSHPRLSHLDDQALEQELESSRLACEKLLGSCETLALPYGDGDERVARAAKAAGYTAVAGLPRRLTAGCGWPRVGVFPADGPRRFGLKVARPVRKLRENVVFPLTARLLRGRPVQRGR